MSIIYKVRNSKVAKTLLANFTYLSIIEVIGLLLPLVTYPYVIRTVGAENYGVVVFCQAIIAYIIIIINFGYNVSATRKVSENRDDIYKIREIYSSVVFQKLLIFILCIVISVVALLFLKFEYSIILLGFIGLCVQEVFFPVWLFQGLEKMKFITIITFFAKCSYLVLIFIFIHNRSDYIYIPILYSVGGVITAIMSMIILKRKFNIYFIKVSVRRLKEDFFESLPFFASRFSTVVMERSNVIAIGSFFSYEMVAIYDICIKIISIIKTPFSLVAQVLYPNVAKSKDMSLVRRSVVLLLVFAILISIVVSIGAKSIVLLLSDSTMLEAVPILRIMTLYIPIVGISYLFGASVLVVQGYSKEYNLSVVLSVVLYVVMLLFFIYTEKVNLYTMTIAYIVPELFIACYRSYIVNKHNLLK